MSVKPSICRLRPWCLPAPCATPAETRGASVRLWRDNAILADGYFDLAAMTHGIPLVTFRRRTDRRVGISLGEQLGLSLCLGQPRCVFALTGRQQQGNGC